MSTNPDIDPKALQRARAQRLRDLLEPWSIRRLETRTGIGRGTLQTRLTGQTELTLSDIELLAPLIRMTPVELFQELAGVTVDRDFPRSGSGDARGISTFAPRLGLEPRTYRFHASEAVVTPITGRQRRHHDAPTHEAIVTPFPVKESA